MGEVSLRRIHIQEVHLSRFPSVARHTAVAICLLTSAAAQAVLAIPAEGAATFSWGLSAENLVTQSYNYLGNDSPFGTFSSGGLQTISSDGVQASVNAWADPTSGLFKSITSVQMSGSTPINIAESYARLDISDTVRVTGPGATATLSITMDYNTTFSGLGMTPFERYQQISHFMQVDSSRYVSASYVMANPDYNPAAQCTDFGSDGIYCPPEAQSTITVNQSAGKDLFREWALGGSQGVYSNGDAENTTYTGQVLLQLVVPTNVDISLNFQLYNGARCFHLANCSLVSDASHSDYLGLVVDEDHVFTSAAGYNYLGLAAAVPEPNAAVLLLAGLSAVGLLRRSAGRRG
jgi:hypothetical protein